MLKQILCFVFLLLISCDRYQSEASYLQKLKDRGFITFITRNTMATYYADRDGQWVGFEYDLAKKFAEDHGLNLRLMVAKTSHEAFQFLDAGVGDFIGASLVATKEREEKYRLGPSILKTQQNVVCHRYGKKAKDRNELKNVNFVVSKNSSHESYLLYLQKAMKNLEWKVQETSSEDLLKQVESKSIDCTVIDSNLLALHQRIMPNLQLMFALTPEQDIQWIVKKDNHQLQRIFISWIEQKRKLGDLQVITDRYFGFITEGFDFYDTKAFEERIKTRLPEWKDLFKKASRQTGIDWKLLAAIAYQESHWDEFAVSPTGVKGIMMLTNATAARMGVNDRTNPEESILAGAKYFLWLKKRYLKISPEPDATYLAMAAYNVGHGHIDDLMEYAKSKNMPFTKWAHIKELLPDLTKPEVFQTLKYGYANGYEPLVYVDRIRNFHKILNFKRL